MRRHRLLVLILALFAILITVLLTSTGLHNLFGNIFWRFLEIRLNATFALGALIGITVGYLIGYFSSRNSK